MLRIAPPVREQIRSSPQGLVYLRMVKLNSVRAVDLDFASVLSDGYAWPRSQPGSRVISIDTGACGVSGCSP